jgi:hypothetical protein
MKHGHIFQMAIALQMKIIQFQKGNQPGIPDHYKNQQQEFAKGVSFMKIKYEMKPLFGIIADHKWLLPQNNEKEGRWRGSSAYRNSLGERQILNIKF